MVVRDEIFDPLGVEMLRDPYPVYRRLREERPVYWHEQLQSWVLTRYADCLFALRDSDLFANDWRRVGIPTPPPLLSLQTLDPPDQTALRNFSVAAVRAQDLAAVAADAERRSEALLDGLSGRDTFDFVKDFADPFALGTICAFVGAEQPPTDGSWDSLNDDLDRSMDFGLDPDGEAGGVLARAAFSDLVERWLAGEPEHGILGYVMRNGSRAGASHEVVVNSIRAFWHAGFEVPSRFLANAVLELLRHPEALAELRRTASLDPAVEELVRFAGPVHVVSRACTEAVELGGQRIGKGEVVVIVLAAANRDPDQWDQPEELRLDRDPNPHIGFGRGAHSCLGLNVARLEARTALAGLLHRYPGLRLAGDPVPRRNATLRGPATLPLAVGPATR